MLRVNIRTKPIQKMRFKDVGDYYWIKSPVSEEDVLKIVVAEMENPDYEFLTALHEFIESYLLLKRGVDFKEIEDWERVFSLKKEKGEIPKNAVAGEQKNCPYKKEHKIALKIEKQMAKYLKVNWKKYDNYLEKLEEEYELN
jgi:hypothetical protein